MCYLTKMRNNKNTKSLKHGQVDMKYLFLTVLAVLFFTAEAADLKTKSGKIYKSYSIIGYCPEGLTILHSSGGGIVSLEDWPDDKKADIAKYINRIEKRRKLAANRPDLKTKSGMVYKKYKILSFQPSGLKISCWNGIKIVDYSDLPDSMQKQYAEEIKRAKPNSVLVLEDQGAESRAPINLKLDKPNSKAGRNDYKPKKKEKDLDDDLDDKPKKPTKTKNKPKTKK